MKASRIHHQPLQETPPTQAEPTPVINIELKAPPPKPTPPPPAPKPVPAPKPAPEPPSETKSKLPKPKPEPKPKHHLHISLKQVKFIALGIGILVLIIAGVMSYKPVSGFVTALLTVHQPAQPTSSPSASPAASLEPTLSAEQNTIAQKILAQSPDTIMYYAYRTVYNTQHVFESDPTGQYQLERKTGYSDVYKFLGSPDGRYVLRWTRNTIDIAASNNIESFGPLAHVEDQGLAIISVAWANDSSSFAFSTAATENTTAPGSGIIYHNRVYTVTVAGQQPTVIRDGAATAQYIIRGYNPSKQQLLWQEQSATTLPQNLTLVNATNGQAVKSFPEFNDPAISASLVITPDLSTAYFLKSNIVMAEKLADQTNKPIYTVSPNCPDGAFNPSNPTGLTVSPDGQALIVSSSYQTCPAPSNFQPSPTPTPITSTTYRINTSNGSVETKVDNAEIASMQQAWWSIDGKYIWTSNTDQQSNMFDANTLQKIPFFASNTPKQRVYFMAWLAK